MFDMVSISWISSTQNYVEFTVNTHATSGWLTGQWLSPSPQRLFVLAFVCVGGSLNKAMKTITFELLLVRDGFLMAATA